MSHDPVPAHAGSRPGLTGWWVLADDDERQLAHGSFNTIAKAAEIALAVSEGRPWRYHPDDRADQVVRGYL